MQLSRYAEAAEEFDDQSLFRGRYVEKVLLHRWRFFRKEPLRCTVAFGRDSLFVVRGWLHRCRIAYTISLYLFLLVASRIFFELYSGFC
jgi:hypothetical protein